MKCRIITKKYLILIFLIIIFSANIVAFYSLAQEEIINKPFNLKEKESIKNFLDKAMQIFENAENKFSNKFFDFWAKIHQEIKENWQGGILPKILDWLKKEISLIKQEFKKELKEMKDDLMRIF